MAVYNLSKEDNEVISLKEYYQAKNQHIYLENFY